MTTTTTSRTGTMMREIRETPLFRQAVPMEAVLGWPTVHRHRPDWNGATSVYLAFPVHTYERAARRGEPSALHAPIGGLTVRWPGGAVVEYVDHRFRRPWPIAVPPTVVGWFPHAAVRDLSTRDYLEARSRLAELYDGLADNLLAGTAFAQAAEFGSLLRRLVEPGLVPYYGILAPRFAERFLGPETEQP